MTDLNTARERFRTHMNGTSRDLSDLKPFEVNEDAEDVTDSLTREHGRLLRIPGTNRAELFVKVRQPGTVMLVLASVLLLALAAGQGYVSYRAQFVFIHSAGKAHLPAMLEALGLDAAAAIFAFLGLAKARQGKPAHIERALNIACAIGSGFMNVLGSDLASPRSVAVYVLPPVLYAATSDRLIAVVASAYGLATRSLWGMAGKAAGVFALYSLRLVLAPPSTAKGLRRSVLNAAPLPEVVAVITDARKPKPIIPPKDRKALPPPKSRANSKTAQFIVRVEEQHGPLSSLPLESVGQVAKQLHGDLNEGEARKQLRNRVLAAQESGAK